MAVDLASGFGEPAARFFGFLGLDSRGLENASRPLIDFGELNDNMNKGQIFYLKISCVGFHL